MTAGYPQGIGYLVLRYVYHLRKLFGGRLTLVLLLELAEGLVDLVQGPHLVQRKSHDAALLRKGLKYGLANPPHGIGYEFETSGLIEFLCGLDQTEIAFVDKVRKAEALVLILLCDGNHETEVCPGKLLESFLVSLAYALGEFHFLFRGNQLLAAYLLEIFVQRGAFAVCDGFCNL